MGEKLFCQALCYCTDLQSKYQMFKLFPFQQPLTIGSTNCSYRYPLSLKLHLPQMAENTTSSKCHEFRNCDFLFELKFGKSALYDQPTHVDRESVDCRPLIDRLLADCWSLVGCLLAVSRSTQLPVSRSTVGH